MDGAGWSRRGAGRRRSYLVPVHVLAWSVVLVALRRLKFSLRVAAGCTLITLAAALGVSALRVAVANLEPTGAIRRCHFWRLSKCKLHYRCVCDRR